MKYLTQLKSKKRLLDELPKLPKAPFDSKDSTKGRLCSESELPEPLPYMDQYGDIVIPFICDSRYHWWAGGQSVTETIMEVRQWQH